MNARQLIEVLQKLDPETLILVDGYEGDYDNINNKHKIEVVKVQDHEDPESECYMGEYREECDYVSNISEKELFEKNKLKAFVLGRG